MQTGNEVPDGGRSGAVGEVGRRVGGVDEDLEGKGYVEQNRLV